jgi:hypothetical protein
MPKELVSYDGNYYTRYTCPKCKGGMARSYDPDDHKWHMTCVSCGAVDDSLLGFGTRNGTAKRDSKLNKPQNNGQVGNKNSQ